MLIYLCFKFNNIWKCIEEVITALTRNQVYGNVSWVRIPPLPPKTAKIVAKTTVLAVFFCRFSSFFLIFGEDFGETLVNNLLCLLNLICNIKVSVYARCDIFHSVALPKRNEFIINELSTTRCERVP